MHIKELTKAEEQVMQILWQLKEAIVKECTDKILTKLDNISER